VEAKRRGSRTEEGKIYRTDQTFLIYRFGGKDIGGFTNALFRKVNSQVSRSEEFGSSKLDYGRWRKFQRDWKEWREDCEKGPGVESDDTSN